MFGIWGSSFIIRRSVKVFGIYMFVVWIFGRNSCQTSASGKPTGRLIEVDRLIEVKFTFDT